MLAGLVVAYAKDITVGLTTNYLVENTLTQTGSLIPAIQELFSVNLRYVVAAILVVAAIWHALIATSLFGRYVTELKNKLTSSNWAELSVLGPWILATVAAFAGVRDIMTLLLIGGSVSIIGVLGYLTDRYTLIGKMNWLKRTIITKALLLPWVVIGVSIWHTNLYGFVTFKPQIYALLIGAFLLYLLLAFAHKQQIRGVGKFQSFEFGERLIVNTQLALLSLLAATTFLV